MRGGSASHGGGLKLKLPKGTHGNVELIAKWVKIKETDMKTKIRGALNEAQF